MALASAWDVAAVLETAVLAVCAVGSSEPPGCFVTAATAWVFLCPL